MGVSTNQPVAAYGQIELEIFRQHKKITGFSITAKETAGREVKKFCSTLSQKWHKNKIKIKVVDKFLMVDNGQDNLSKLLKIGLTEKDAAALGEMINNGFEVQPVKYQLNDGRFGLRVLGRSKK